MPWWMKLECPKHGVYYWGPADNPDAPNSCPQCSPPVQNRAILWRAGKSLLTTGFTREENELLNAAHN